MQKALIVQKYWLDKIYDEDKVWEMRSRPTKVRGKILLIESGSGLVTGETSIVDCLPPLVTLNDMRTSEHKHGVNDLRLLDKWRYPWVLKDSARYKEPIPYTHPRGAVVWVNVY